MKLSELVRPEHVVLPLTGSTLAEAALSMIDALGPTGVITDLERLKARVAEARGEDIVVLGDRAFITHYRTDAVHDLVVAIGIADVPIVREVGESERQAARIVLLILAPPRLAGRYLQLLGAFARLLSRPPVVEQLLAAPSAVVVAALPLFAEVEIPPQLTVREIMAERPRTTSPDTPLREAALEMVRSRVGALPVVESDGLLVGMLSERELMRHMLNVQFAVAAHRPESAVERARRSVRDVMTRQVLCVSPDQPLAEVAALMINKDVDRVPVVREGRLVGFLTRGDIVRQLIGY